MRTNFVFRYCTPLSAALAVCLVGTSVLAVPVAQQWEPADFSGAGQTWTGTASSGGQLSIGPTGGFLPDPGFGFDVFIPGPQALPMIQTAPAPVIINNSPIGINSDGAGTQTGGPQIHFDGITWFPEEITDFSVDFLNGGTIALSHDEIAVSVILGAPTSPPGIPAVLGIDLDLVVTGWSFFQTGPTVFTNPGAAHSEYFIPGFHRFIVDSTMVIAGGLQTIPLLEGAVVDGPGIGLAGTMWSEHAGMDLSTTMMGPNNFFLPFDAELDIGDIGGNGTVTLTGGATILTNYSLTTTVVPEPSSIVLLGFGLVGVCVAVMRRRRRLAA